MTEQAILDMCCGSRMFWLDKTDPRAVFCDIRAEEHVLCDERRLVISPDVIAAAVRRGAGARKCAGNESVAGSGLTYYPSPAEGIFMS